MTFVRSRPLLFTPSIHTHLSILVLTMATRLLSRLPPSRPRPTISNKPIKKKLEKIGRLAINVKQKFTGSKGNGGLIIETVRLHRLPLRSRLSFNTCISSD
jgi:hypothetical protein